MGGIVSKDISSLSKYEIAELIVSIGSQYAKYKDAIIDNEIDGSTISILSDEELVDALKDIGISVIHSAKIRSEFSKLKNGTSNSNSSNNNSSNSNSNDSNNDNSKFNCPVEYFVFGDEKAFRDGLLAKTTSLTRSMEDECTINDDGKWKQHYMYVVYQSASELMIDETQPHRIRDQGHNGMTLNDFCNHFIAKEAELTQAEVASIRMYTGPFYIPWNTALRNADKNPSLLHSWQTCISVLYNAILKLSYLSQRGTVYRGVNESKLKINEKFYKQDGDGFAGGVELAFMSTTTDKNVAIEYARRGSTIDCTIFEITLDMASRGAAVKEFSQYPYENEILYTPFTCITCEKKEERDGVRYLYVRASVSTARPDVKQILKVTDKLVAAVPQQGTVPIATVSASATATPSSSSSDVTEVTNKSYPEGLFTGFVKGSQR